MSFEDNKAIVARFWEIWNRGDWAALDTCLRADYVHHPGANSLSLTQFKQGSAHTRQALPDFQLTLEDVVAEEDKVVVRVTGRGTHSGSYLGETPTGKSITACGVVIHRLSGSMIVEDWEFFDVVSLLQQLGVLPQKLGVQRDDKKHLPPGDAQINFKVTILLRGDQNAEAKSSQMWCGGSGGRA